MPGITFTAFLSCSFSEEDQGVVDFFKSYCESLGFGILKYDYQEPITLSEAVKNHIRNADCLIAVATRRSRLADAEEWVSPSWIEHEVVFANAVGKPIVIFAEEGVRVAGLIARDERFQRFSRDELALLKQVPYFNKFLMSLRSILEHQFKAGADSSPVLFHHCVRSRDEMISPSTFVTTCELEMEALADNVDRSVQEFGDIDWLRSASEAVKDFEFHQLEAPPGVRLYHEMGRRPEDPSIWHCRFSPPLKQGQRVKYAFRYVCEHVRPFTWEDAEEAIRAQRFWCDQPKCAVHWEMDVPTGEMVSEVVFLPKYPIHAPEFHVEVGESGVAALDEMGRIKETDGFKVQRFFERYTLILSVKRPVKGCSYMLCWQPPKRSEVADWAPG